MKELRKQSIEELTHLCEEIRQKIIQTVSHNGGHLSSNVGAVELIVAMHYVFDAQNDPFIFDVSHQAYTHKLLTDRWGRFDTLRTLDGISGYTRPDESPYDYFIAGHSSTSISLAVGAAKAIALKGEQAKRLPVALIGDGSLSAGMVYEALNELGDRRYPVVIILNDNKMSIAKPIGAISKFLSQAMAGDFYQKIKKTTEQILQYLPESATYMAKKFEESFKLITPGILFEELGIDYIGPIDGHDLESLIRAMQSARSLKKPVIIHAQTLKGKGYEMAEGYYEKWHGVGPFDVASGEAIKQGVSKNATTMYSEALMALAKEHDNVVGVTAAMPSGTGLSPLIQAYPNRFWDVAIAEQHAVTSMCSMAKEGFKPFVSIYSTFLQRAYDQVIHDACILNLNVVFAIDRAGIVGEDGETHQGAFDISYLSAIPNMTLMAPRDEASMHEALRYAYMHEGPLAIRYPRGSFGDCSAFASLPFEYAKAQTLQEGKDSILLVGYGSGVGKAIEVAHLLKAQGIQVGLVDLRFAKPLDETTLLSLSKHYATWYVISDSAKIGGIGTLLLSFKEKHDLSAKIHTFEYEDAFITHGETHLVEERLGISAPQIAQKILLLYNNK
ncbi:1-deoxy-D-xylulose-5-phosphate synthase [Sulfurospirillum sp. MES]|uniref:1-deoxy-D-xylulose-5-phosphate synthase n=1 Tax=Sulfurospirillum sp. MES TaxID=1565314 RepID=UPI000543885F|nr:1-deoxy-D-xylulose-5-phosphate synthase [Sulfurospirillum sp. MES]KHG34781.1 MAG: 1-deoxy-D-xylulose-5-phosphate synthase [Sulfurospirillum sp. MES]